MANVQYNPLSRQMYTSRIPNIAGDSMWSNPNLWQGYINNGLVKVIGGAAKPNQPSMFDTASISTNYTPNQYTAKQLAGYGSGGGVGGNAMPEWMHQAFSKKMAGMNAPSNGPLPYQLTSSSFRGMPSGKAAPAGGK